MVKSTENMRKPRWHDSTDWLSSNFFKESHHTRSLTVLVYKSSRRACMETSTGAVRSLYVHSPLKKSVVNMNRPNLIYANVGCLNTLNVFSNQTLHISDTKSYNQRKQH